MSPVVTVEAIHLGAEEAGALWPVDEVQAVAGQGLEGDRHFHADGARPGQALTLVAADERRGLPGSRRARRGGR